MHTITEKILIILSKLMSTLIEIIIYVCYRLYHRLLLFVYKILILEMGIADINIK